jgi:hypothetical protein
MNSPSLSSLINMMPPFDLLAPFESRNFNAVSVSHLSSWSDPFQELPDWHGRNSSDETAEIAGHNRIESSTPEQTDGKARQ